MNSIVDMTLDSLCLKYNGMIETKDDIDFISLWKRVNKGITVPWNTLHLPFIINSVFLCICYIAVLLFLTALNMCLYLTMMVIKVIKVNGSLQHGHHVKLSQDFD